MMNSDASIETKDVSVLFPLYHGNSRSLKKMLVAAASGRLAEDQQHRVVDHSIRHSP
jgi:lipopolysaccharide transport system ATP-binding protein